MAASSGHADAQFILGRASLTYGAESFQLILSAAESGHIEAMETLGNYYQHGLRQHELCIRRSKKEAGKWYQRAAECGSERAKLMLTYL